MSMITMGMGYASTRYLQPADLDEAGYDLAPPDMGAAGYPAEPQPADVTGVTYG